MSTTAFHFHNVSGNAQAVEPSWPSQWRDAAHYFPDDDLTLALELAVNLRRPLRRAFEARGHVVLLFDEMDKAPPDLPNDLLLELDRYRFEVPELGAVISRSHADGEHFLCIVTSNEQRPLPDAFLRRCLHHRI